MGEVVPEVDEEGGFGTGGKNGCLDVFRMCCRSEEGMIVTMSRYQVSLPSSDGISDRTSSHSPPMLLRCSCVIFWISRIQQCLGWMSSLPV